MTSRTSRTLLRRTTAAAAALVLGLALAACGGDDGEPDDAESSSTQEPDSPSDPSTSDDRAQTEPTEPTEPTEDVPAGVPSEDELAAALLTTDDVPAGFTAGSGDDEEEDDDAFAGTCLADVGEFSDALGFEPDAEAEVELLNESQTGQGLVGSQIEAYADPSAVTPAFAEFTDTLQSCTSLSTTDAAGVSYELDIAYDDAVDLPGADDQLRVEMTGTISSGAETVDITYRFVVALTGQFISIVGTYAVGEDTTGILDLTGELATLQASRVNDLAG